MAMIPVMVRQISAEKGINLIQVFSNTSSSSYFLKKTVLKVLKKTAVHKSFEKLKGKDLIRKNNYIPSRGFFDSF